MILLGTFWLRACDSMLFVDDIVLIDETIAGINYKLKLWEEALESKSF